MATSDKLAEYRRRRSSGKSPEPTGSGSSGRGGKDPVFVVQRHDARNLHFDFRLQVDDVLVSWAVPKGPSVDPRDKRLATQTEDHPLDYADFEGTIPRGEYGGGSVVVWDTGTWQNRTTDDGEDVDAGTALAAGHLRFALAGTKLQGEFALTHTKMGGDDSNWLLVKVDDEHADRRRKPATAHPESALTGRTNEQVAEGDSTD